MSFGTRVLLRAIALAGFLLAATQVHAEYLRIQIRVYGWDCELCARAGFSQIFILRLNGVKSIDVSLKKGILDIALTPGNTLKLSDLRKTHPQNGFRSTEATVTAVGQFSGSKFEVLGAGESYDANNPDPKASAPAKLTFDVH